MLIFLLAHTKNTTWIRYFFQLSILFKCLYKAWMKIARNVFGIKEVKKMPLKFINDMSVHVVADFVPFRQMTQWLQKGRLKSWGSKATHFATFLFKIPFKIWKFENYQWHVSACCRWFRALSANDSMTAEGQTKVMRVKSNTFATLIQNILQN